MHLFKMLQQKIKVLLTDILSVVVVLCERDLRFMKSILGLHNVLNAERFQYDYESHIKTEKFKI